MALVLLSMRRSACWFLPARKETILIALASWAISAGVMAGLRVSADELFSSSADCSSTKSLF